MKTIKAIFVILFLITMFMSCETNSIEDEVGIEDVETFGSEDEEGEGVEIPNSPKG